VTWINILEVHEKVIKVQKLSKTPCTCYGSKTVLPKTSICLSLIEEFDAGVMFNETNTR
jgi:hypothetical protein